MTDADTTSSGSSQLQGDVLCIALSPTLDVSSETERVVPMRKTRTSQQQWAPGRGAVNVARVIQRLGGHPDLLYCSGGPVGKIFDECLSEFSFPRIRIAIDGETRIAFMVAVEYSSGVSIHSGEPAAGPADSGIDSRNCRELSGPVYHCQWKSAYRKTC